MHILKICEHEERFFPLFSSYLSLISLSLRIYFNKNKIFALFANYVSLWRDIAFLLVISLIYHNFLFFL